LDIGITIHADITLSIDQVWPDGNAPENPTAQDVVNLLEECGSKRRALDDWCLLDDLDVWVDVGRKHAEAWAPTGVQQEPAEDGGS
jgi:hypothetical protein